MGNTLGFQEIKKLLPHRFPFLMVDKILDYEVGKSILGVKNVTGNENFFQGHFPEIAVMPGVLLIEALAQTAGVLYFLTTNTKASPDNWFYFASIDNARFKHVVVPGDQLLLHVRMIKNRLDIYVFEAEVKVDDKLVCSAEFKIAKGVLKND